MCPTRELADQVAKELRRIARFKHNIKILMLTGGESFGRQLGSLEHQAHIVVGTPGRILKHLNKESLELSNLQTLVLDEADRMLDMGFLEEVEAVILTYGDNGELAIIESNDNIVSAIENIIQPGDIVITLGAGTIYKFGEDLIKNNSSVKNV
jgi:ATP-independent RNA helicase DbpA